MGASEIKAGSAYVEIGGRTQAFNTALDKVKSGLASLSSYTMKVGAGMFAMGGAALAPLLSSAKALADYGENIGKLASKTGMSTQMLSGLGYAAKASGISMSVVSSGMRAMQKNGLSDDTFLPAVDAIAGIADSGERAQAAMKIFGKAGTELLPIIEGGSAEIMRLGREAETLGLTLGSKASAAATQLDTSLDRLSGAAEGLKLHIGAALAPMLSELGDRFIDIVIYAKEWVDVNPELIQTFAKAAVEVTAVGAALMVAGGAIAALTSPILMTTLGIAGIGVALLAVLDVVGVTNTGFGELFNSIRIDGTGLGTWMGLISLNIQKAFNALWDSVSDGFGFIVHHAQRAGTYLVQAWVFIPKTIMEAFSLMSNGMAGIFNKLIEAYNAVATKLGGTEIKFRFGTEGGMFANTAKSFGAISEGAANFRGSLDRSYDKDNQGTAAYRKQRDRLMDQDFTKTAARDSGKTGTGIDTAKLKESLMGIVNKGWDFAAKQLGGVTANIPHRAFEKPGEKPEGAISRAEGPKMSAVGTFSGYGGGALAATGVFNQQLHEQKETNKHLSSIDKNTKSGGAVFVG